MLAGDTQAAASEPFSFHTRDSFLKQCFWWADWRLICTSQIGGIYALVSWASCRYGYPISNFCFHNFLVYALSVLSCCVLLCVALCI